jgi:zinc protease
MRQWVIFLMLAFAPIARAVDLPFGKSFEKAVQKNVDKAVEKVTDEVRDEAEQAKKKAEAAKKAAEGAVNEVVDAAVHEMPGLTLPRLALEKYVLANGLEVILQQDRGRPNVAVNVWYHVGAGIEENGKRGLAPLVERLMFQGSAHVEDGGHVRRLVGAGASVVSGSTDFARTHFFQSVPSDALALTLWLEADRMGWLASSLTEEKLAALRAVVRSERRAFIEAAPYAIAEEVFWQKVIPENHPHHRTRLDSNAEENQATVDDIKKFYDNYFAPSNATLCVVGNFEIDEIKKLIDRYFSTLSPWPRPPRPQVAAPVLATEVRVDVTETVAALPLVEVMWLAPGRGGPDEQELRMLARILGDGVASKMQDALLVQNELAQEVSVTFEAGETFSTFRIRAVVRPGVAPEDVLNTIQSQLDYLGDVPVTPEEVGRARSRLATEFVFALQDDMSRAELLQEGNHYDGHPAAFIPALQKLHALTADDVMRAFRAHLAKDRRAVLVAVPAPRPGDRAPTSAPHQGER